MKFDRMGRRDEYIETVRDDETGSVVTNKHQRFVYDSHLCIQRLNRLPTRYGDGVEFQKCLRKCRGY
ncbi:MAG: hypothetical protein MJ109_07375 [Kiritimatiellae bacterium]|nr:hypothetical protein [Kiritimatiellia bacterium]